MKDKNLPEVFATSPDSPSPWILRKQALERKLRVDELVRVILHIAKHRGYGDLRYTIDESDDKAKILGAINKNKDFIAEKDFATATCALLDKFSKKEIKSLRNRQIDGEKADKFGKKEKITNYDNSIPQSLTKAELELILRKQSEFGFKFSNGFCEKIVEIAFFSNPLKDFEDKVGECEFIKGEKRAPKFSPLAQEFIAISKIVNKLIEITKITGESKGKFVTAENIEKILTTAKRKNKFTFSDLAKELNLSIEQIPGAKIKASGGGEFIDFTKYNKFTKICKVKLGEDFCHVENPEFNEIAVSCTYKKDLNELKKSLLKYEFTDDELKEFLDLGFKQNINLSLKAIKAILPFLKSGKTYDEACELAKLKPEIISERSEFLPPLCQTCFSLSNPVVIRSVAQYRKVLNALIRKYGAPDEIRFELARETMKSPKERKEIENLQKERFSENEKAKEICTKIGLIENNSNILKIKLWNEQSEFCVYSGRKIKISDLQAQNVLEIDHILPYSRSFDDGFNNKVLVFRSQNQIKASKTPYEAWGKDDEKWGQIQTFAATIQKKNPVKFKNITTQKFTDRKNGFRQSAYNDTAYMCRLIMNYTREYLKLREPTDNRKRQIFSINGGFTSVLRRLWGLADKDRSSHLHHAEDAIIIAMSDERAVNAFSNYMKKLEANKRCEFTEGRTSEEIAKKIGNADYKTRITFTKYADFAPNFRNEVLNSVSKIFVSRPPIKKISGALHEQTIISRKDAIKLYKTEDNFTAALETRRLSPMRNGFVKNESMPRIDIFTHKKTGKFFAVPIYILDFANNKLPNKAVVGLNNGKIREWIEMDENYEFKFSLYQNDLIKIRKKDMKEPVLAYYQALGVATASIRVAKRDNKVDNLSEDEKILYGKIKNSEKSDKLVKVEQESLGIQNLNVFKKMKVSVLGEISEAPFEPRMGVNSHKKDTKWLVLMKNSKA